MLNSTQLAFVWDHNFLYGWRNSCCALFCVDILVLQRQKLVYFEGDIAACLKKLRQNRNHILTSQLMERFKYYMEKGLIPDIDASTFADDEDVGEERSEVVSSPRQVRRGEWRTDGRSPQIEPVLTPLVFIVVAGFVEATSALQLPRQGLQAPGDHALRRPHQPRGEPTLQ